MQILNRFWTRIVGSIETTFYKTQMKVPLDRRCSDSTDRTDPRRLVFSLFVHGWPGKTKNLEGWGTSQWRPRWRSGFWFHRACWVLNNWVPSLLVNWFLYQKIWITLTKWIQSTFTFGWTWTRNWLWTQIISSLDPVHIEQIPKGLWLRKGQFRND